jgi:sec-independent protein translocase protein TatC
MATKLRPIGHQDRLSVIDHLDELRSRLIVVGITLTIAVGVCFWQNGRLIELLNKPLERSTPTAQHCGRGRLAAVGCAQTEQRKIALDERVHYLALARNPNLTPSTRAEFSQLARDKTREAAVLPATVPKRRPITTGVGEPFTVTLTIAFYFGLLLSLPILLYQLYAFVIPAFSPTERRVAFPLMLSVPFLFLAGVAFGYELVLPPAIKFLQNFNDNSFDVLIQAKDYYKFAVFTLLALGLFFQIPVGAFVLGRAGVLTRGFLTRNWRYAIIIIAVLAAALPGVDPVTTALEMVPLTILYGVSILLVPKERPAADLLDEDEDVPADGAAPDEEHAEDYLAGFADDSED